MKSLGIHILAELYECDKEILNDVKQIEFIMNIAAKRAKTTILKSVFHRFSPQGVTGVVVISESHFSIHTWPEWSYAAADLFTCGKGTKIGVAFRYLEKKLKAGFSTRFTFRRGQLRRGKEI